MASEASKNGKSSLHPFGPSKTAHLADRAANEFNGADMSPTIWAQVAEYDEDTPMSDISHVSAGPQLVETCEEYGGIQECNSEQPPRKLILRPDTAGSDAARDFNVPLKKPAKHRGFCRKTKLILAPLSQIEDMDHGHSPTDVNSKLGNSLARHTCTSEEAELADFSLLPRKSDPKVLTAKSSEVQQAPATEVEDSETEEQEGNQDGEIDSKPSPLSEERNKNRFVENVKNVNPDEVNERHTDVVTASSSRSEQVGEPSPGNASPQSLVQTTTPNRSRTAEIIPHTPLSDRTRITKVHSQSHHNKTRVPEHTLSSQLTGSTRTNPSEEDLLTFLMHQARRRAQYAASYDMRLADLTETNHELEEVKTTLKSKLIDVTAERNELQKNVENSRDQLDSFKYKYQKLKAWALAMNSEYAALRQQGDELNLVCTNLREQYTEISRPVKATLALNNESITGVARIKQSLSEMQKSVQLINEDIQRANITIAEKSAEVRTLRACRSEQDSHRQELLTFQERYDARTTQHQEMLAKSLNDLAHRIGTISAQAPPPHDLHQCLEMLGEIAQRNSATKSGVEGVQATLTQLTERISLLHDGLERISQSGQDLHHSNLIKDDLVSINKALKGIEADLSRSQDLRQTNATLQERVTGETQIRKLIEEAKDAAETRQIEVQKNNDKLINSLTSLKEDGQKRHSQISSECETRFSTLITKWTTATKELEETKLRVKQCQEESAKWKACWEDSEKLRVVREKDLSAHHKQIVDDIQDESSSRYNELKTKLENTILERDRELEMSTKAMQKSRSEIATAEQDLKRLMAEKAELLQIAAQKDQELASLVATAERQSGDSNLLLQEQDRVKNAMTRVTDLTSRLEDKNRLIERLEAGLRELEGVQEELKVTQTRFATKESIIVELQKKVLDNEHLFNAKEMLTQQVAHFQEELKSHSQDAEEARTQAIVIKELREGIDKKDTDARRLHMLLEDEKRAHAEAQNALFEKLDLELRNKELQTELQNAMQLKDQIASLQDQNNQKDSTIAGLNKQIADTRQAERDKLMLKEQLGKKGWQNKVQNAEIEETQPQLAQQEQFRIGSVDNGMDGFFSQKTDLSIDETALCNKKKVSSTPLQSASMDNRATANHLKGTINPHVIMKATSSLQQKTDDEHSLEPLSQTSVIPDSQLDPATELLQSSSALQDLVRVAEQTSSPLSEVSTDCIDEIYGENEIDSDHERDHMNMNEDDSDEGESDDNIKHTSPQHPQRFRVSKTVAHRPSSIISHDDMLLQASETGRHSSPKTSKSQHGHPISDMVDRSSREAYSKKGKTAVTSASPQKLRNDSQSEPRLNNTVDTDSTALNLPVIPREPTRPNSAVKRRISDDTFTNSNGQPIAKRLKLITSRIGPKPGASQRHISTTQATIPANDLPSGSRTSGTTTENAGTSGRTTRRLKTNRARSRQDKYTERFSGDGRI